MTATLKLTGEVGQIAVGMCVLGCIINHFNTGQQLQLIPLMAFLLHSALLRGNHSSHHRLTSLWKKTLKIKFNPIKDSCLIFERQRLSTKVVFFWIGCALYRVDDNWFCTVWKTNNLKTQVFQVINVNLWYKHIYLDI